MENPENNTDFNLPENVESDGLVSDTHTQEEDLKKESQRKSLDELLDFFANLSDEPRRLKARLQIKITNGEVTISDLAMCKAKMNKYGDLSKKRPYMDLVKYIVGPGARARNDDRTADTMYKERVRHEKNRMRHPKDIYNGGIRD